MPRQSFLGYVPFLAIVLTMVVIALANRLQQSDRADEAWLRAGWTVARRDVNRLLGRASSVFTRVHRGMAFEFISESPPSSAAPFHEVMAGRFSARWSAYLRVQLDAPRACSFQLFERVALVRAPISTPSAVGAVWLPRWKARTPIGDSRLDSRFELYAEDPTCAVSAVTASTVPLLAAPHFGLLQVVGPELRVYVSYKAAGLIPNQATELAAHIEALSHVVVDVASALEDSTVHT